MSSALNNPKKNGSPSAPLPSGASLSAPNLNGTKPQDFQWLKHVRYEHLLAGVSGGVVSTLVLHPLDLLKVRFAGEISNFLEFYSRLINLYRSQRWPGCHSAHISWFRERRVHHSPRRGLQRPVPRCRSQLLGCRRCLGPLFSIVSHFVLFPDV